MSETGFKQKLMSALGWSAALKFGFQMLSWVMTLAVIRVLSPDDYGLMAISQAFTAFMLGFANLGLGDALLQKEDTPPRLVSYAFGLLLLVSVTLCALLSLAAYPIGAWYGDARLVPLIQVSSLGFVFNALVLVPRTMLQKRMQMRPIFIADLSSGLIGAAVTTVLAFSGYGVWALMLGTVAGAVSRQAAFIWVAARFYVWPRINIGAIRPMLGFGAYATLEYTAFMLMVTADVLIVSRVLGPSDAGIYIVVLNFAAMPLNKIAPVINSIAFPAFALVQGELSHARYYLLKGVRLMSVLTVPVFFGIAVTAPEIVDLVFGPTWAAARPVLPILSIALTFRATLILFPNYLQGIGDAKGSFLCTAVGAAVVPLAILIGCHWGLAGACWAWLACYPIVFTAEAIILATRGALPLRDILTAPLQPMAAGALMAAAVLATRALLPPNLPETLRLAILVGAGALAYGGTILLLFGDLAGELRRLVMRRGAAA